MTDIRVTRQAAEVLTEAVGTPEVRNTRVVLEVLASPGVIPSVRNTRIALEVVFAVAGAATGGSRRSLILLEY